MLLFVVAVVVDGTAVEYFILFVYIIVEGVVPVPVQFSYSHFLTKSSYRLNPMSRRNLALVVELSVSPNMPFKTVKSSVPMDC